MSATGRSVSTVTPLYKEGRYTADLVNVATAIETYFTQMDLAASTERVYRFTLNAFIEDAGPKTPIADLSADDIFEFLSDRYGDKSAGTYNRNRTALCSFFTFCARHDWIAANPVSRVETRRQRGTRATPMTDGASERRAVPSQGPRYSP